MTTFLIISRHTPEECPAFNEKAKKVTSAMMNKMDEWTKKYAVKMVGSCTVFNEHLIVMICEAPNFEVMQKMMMEPENIAMNAISITEVKAALNMEESLKLMQQNIRI